jgi:hypothetical protein
MRNRAIKQTIQRRLVTAIAAEDSATETVLRNLAAEFGIKFSARTLKKQVRALLSIECPF